MTTWGKLLTSPEGRWVPAWDELLPSPRGRRAPACQEISRNPYTLGLIIPLQTTTYVNSTYTTFGDRALLNTKGLTLNKHDNNNNN